MLALPLCMHFQPQLAHYKIEQVFKGLDQITPMLCVVFKAQIRHTCCGWLPWEYYDLCCFRLSVLIMASSTLLVACWLWILLL